MGLDNFLAFTLLIASRELEGIVSSIIVMLFSVVTTMSGLVVDTDKSTGKVAGGDPLALSTGRSVYNFEVGELLLRLERQYN